MKPIYANGFLKGGKLELDDRFEFNTSLKRAPDGRVQVRVGPPARSEEAHNYMWLVLDFIETHGETGHTAEELHEYFKREFLPKRVAISDGNGVIVDDVVIGGSTTKLPSRDFADYVNKIRHFSITRLGVETPDPDPRLSKKWKRAREAAAIAEQRKTA